MKSLIAVLLFTLTCTIPPVPAQIVISEFLAKNSNGIKDENGDREDWIELHNMGADAVNLSGWYLTDDAADLTKWVIPAVILPAGSSRLFWASDKNRKDPDEELHTNFKLSGGGEFLALVKPDGITIASGFSPAYPPQVDDVSYGYPMTVSSNQVLSSHAPCKVHVPTDDSLGLSWISPVFNDFSWQSGNTGVGYATDSSYAGQIHLDVQSSMYNIGSSLYMRIPFTIPPGSNPTKATLRLYADDGFRVYINGDDEPSTWNNITEGYSWNDTALNDVDAAGYAEYDLGSVGSLAAGANLLAIQGVNISSNDTDFFILPELYIYTSSLTTNTPKYFQVPTPESENIGGTDNIGPRFSDVTHDPLEPQETEDLLVTVKVTDEDGIQPGSMKIKFQVMYTNDKQSYKPMYDDGTNGDAVAGDGIYSYTIPASKYSSGEMIRYRFEATDNDGNMTRWPLFHDPLNSAEYFGTICQINVPSTMPVYHWFVRQPTKPSSRASLYYNGEFYDNILSRQRGKSTSHLTAVRRKSFKLDFNRGDHFEYDPDERKAEEINLNTTYGDKTYLRRMLAWKSYEQMDAVGCNSFLVHLRRNNQFFGVQNFEEQIDSDFLKRHGYDPEGAMWKVINYEGNHVSHNGHQVAKKSRKEDPALTDQDAPVHALIDEITAYNTGHMIDNMDMANLINYLALITIMHDWDVAAKNHYYYQDTDGTGEWSVFPWDKDLTYGSFWANNSIAFLHDDLELPTGISAFPTWSYIQRAINAAPDLKALYLRRLRTALDELVQQNATPTCFTEQLITDLLDTHEPDLLLDKAEWGSPWAWGTDWSPRQANITQTINGYLNPARSFFYAHPDLPAAQPPVVSIEISHVEVTPPSGNQQEEYVELYNPNSYAVDLSGWKLDSAVKYTFPGGTVIPANGNLYVSPDNGAFRRRATSPKAGERCLVHDRYKGGLSSRGETLLLLNQDGIQIDSRTWAPNESDTQKYLRITEVMYHPDPPNGLTEDRLEFVELKNIGPAPLNIGGTYFSEGLVFNNPDITLPPGAYLTIANDVAAFASQYNTNGMTVVGGFVGYLSNGNDTLELEDPRGETIQKFKYNDDWYPNTDGDGFSLALINPENPDLDSWSRKISWKASEQLGGTPGTAESGLPAGAVIINEILAHSDTGTDWIELKNTTGSPIDISYWFLSDDSSNPKKYRIPPGTTILPNSFYVISEAQFNVGTNSFALSELGDELVLTMALSDGTLMGYQQIREFDATGQDIPIGYWYDSEGDKQFIPLASQTPGAENSGPKTGPVVIDEIMYKPAANNIEYIVLSNTTANTVALYDTAYPTNGWSLSGAVDYTFPTGTTLAGNETILISGTNPPAFRTIYTNVPPALQVLGPFDGKLDNSGERLKLNYPGNPEPTFVPQILIESVNYDPLAPWPVPSALGGTSIKRVSGISPANDPASWAISTNGYSTSVIIATNLPPEFTVDPVIKPAAVAGESYTESLTGSAYDPENDTLTFSKTGGPSWLTISGTGVLSGTPGTNDVGRNAFTIEVSADGGTDSATLEINVDAASPPPAAGGSGTVYDFTSYASGVLSGQDGWVGSHTVSSGALLLDESSDWLTATQTAGVDATTNEEFTVTARFSFSESRNFTADQQFFNIMLLDNGSGPNGTQFRLALHRTAQETYAISLWNDDHTTFGNTSFPAADIGLGTETDSDFLELVMTVEKQETVGNWDFTIQLNNLTSSQTVATATSTVTTFAALYESPVLYAAINGGQIVGADVINRKVISLSLEARDTRPDGGPSVPSLITEYDFSQGYNNGNLAGQHGWSAGGGQHTIASGELILANSTDWVRSSESTGVDTSVSNVFMVSAEFSFSETGTYSGSPSHFMNIMLLDNAANITGNHFRQLIRRTGENTYEIALYNDDHTEFGSTAFNADRIGLDMNANADLDSDRLEMSLIVEKGASAGTWTYTLMLKNITTGGNTVATSSGAVNSRNPIYTASRLYGMINGGQVIDSSMANRKVYTFKVGIPPSGTAWDIFANAYGISGNPADDADGNGLTDWGEYIFGGNPTNPSDFGHQPQFDAQTGNYLFYLIGDDALTAHVLTKNSLTDPSWTTSDTVYVSDNSGLINTYSNQTGTVSNQLFMKLLVE